MLSFYVGLLKSVEVKSMFSVNFCTNKEIWGDAIAFCQRISEGPSLNEGIAYTVLDYISGISELLIGRKTPLLNRIPGLIILTIANEINKVI